MSATHDVDRLLATWFAADATETAPAGLVEAIAETVVTTRRRPGWLSLDRWLPTLPAVPMAVRLVAVAALLIAVAIASLIWPAPGPACHRRSARPSPASSRSASMATS